MPKQVTVTMNANQQAAMNKVIEDFRNGSVAAKCAIACFPNPRIPAHKWTLRNQMLAYLTTGCLDARGYKQWRKVGRFVKKGEKAGYIWMPLFKFFTKDDPETGDKIKGKYLIGFKALSKFGVDATEGKPLDYQKDQVLPDNLPFLEVAEKWGIKVNAKWQMGGARGCYHVDGTQIEIGVTPDFAPKVFFHELAHASHARLLKKWGKKMTGGQDPLQEITAELSAEILRRMVDPEGKIYPDTSGNSLDYVKHYADHAGIDLNNAILKVLGEVGQVVGQILEEAGVRDPADYGDQARKPEPKAKPQPKPVMSEAEMAELDERYQLESGQIPSEVFPRR
jgi:antirestriction protein ArdC